MSLAFGWVLYIRVSYLSQVALHLQDGLVSSPVVEGLTAEQYERLWDDRVVRCPFRILDLSGLIFDACPEPG